FEGSYLLLHAGINHYINDITEPGSRSGARRGDGPARQPGLGPRRGRLPGVSRRGFSMIVVQRRRVDRDLVAWIRNVDPHLQHVGVSVRPLGEGSRRIDLVVHDVVALGHPGDVDPLPAQLLEVPVPPSRADALAAAGVAVAVV